MHAKHKQKYFASDGQIIGACVGKFLSYFLLAL